MGSTFIGVLERYAKTLHANGNTLMLVSVNPAVYDQLKETECLQVLGEKNVFVANQPGATIMHAYRQAQQIVQP